MSAKLLMGLSEENNDLEKQIGCMTGIFQVFDRHHFLTGRRLTRRLPSGLPRSSSTTSKEECNLGSPQIVVDYSSSKSSEQNQRVSVESWRTKTSNIMANSMHNDFRDVIKDSINGETRVISVKTSVVKEEVKKENALKHKDSPRPIMSLDLNDSLQVLVRHKESPWNVSEGPRFSCDGREISRCKSSTMIRELPRLSLDSKSSSFDSKTKEMDRSSLSPRIPSVIAKLMGLEDLPSSESPRCAGGKNDHPIHSKPISNHTETVYSQIERRVQELDFSPSNKDLRALKHVLDRMQANGLLDDQQSKPNQSWKPKTLETPIVIMKPAKSIERSKDLEGLSGLRKLRTKDSAGRKKANGHAPLSENSSPKIKIPRMQQSPRPQKLVRERSGNPVKKLSSLSPRVKRGEVELEKKPRATRRENDNRKPLKPSRARKGTQQGKRANVIPQREDRNISLATQVDAEVMEDDRSMIMDSTPFQQDYQKIQNANHSSTDPMINLVEQPSPISVLETSFYQDDLPLSPVKKISRALEDDEIETSSVSLVNSTPSKLSSEIHLHKVSTIRNLVEKLVQIGSTVETDALEPDHDPASQILKAAGLLSKSNIDLLHKDLILDVVKDILVQKMEFTSHVYRPNKCNRQNLLAELCSEIKQVLVERPKSASLEDECTRFHDGLMRQSNGWQEFGIEMPGLVLEIERSIFKDLIHETVIGEVCSSLLAKGNRRRKQLFPICQN